MIPLSKDLISDQGPSSFFYSSIKALNRAEMAQAMKSSEHIKLAIDGCAWVGVASLVQGSGLDPSVRTDCVGLGRVEIESIPAATCDKDLSIFHLSHCKELSAVLCWGHLYPPRLIRSLNVHIPDGLERFLGESEQITQHLDSLLVVEIKNAMVKMTDSSSDWVIPNQEVLLLELCEA